MISAKKLLVIVGSLSIALVFAYLTMGFLFPTEEEVRIWVYTQATIGVLILIVSSIDTKIGSKILNAAAAILALVNFLIQIVPALLWIGYNGKLTSDNSDGFIGSWICSTPHIALGILNIYLFCTMIVFFVNSKSKTKQG